MTNIKKEYSTYIKHTVKNNNTIKVTSLGVTSLLFDDGKTKLLFDGMVTRPSLIKTVFTKLDSDYTLCRKIVDDCDMKGLNGIFVSHSHYDHVLDVPNFSKLTGSKVYGSKSTINVLKGNGVPEDKLILFNTDDEYSIGDFKIKVMKSIHSKPNAFNNDLGVEITEPLKYPAKMSKFTEGGSFDFYIEHKDKKIVIRPSCNYIESQFDNYHADILFLGIGMMSKLTSPEKDIFYRETVGKLKPKLVIPIHWDNFFLPLDKANSSMPLFLDDTKGNMDYLIERLKEDSIDFRLLTALDYTNI